VVIEINAVNASTAILSVGSITPGKPPIARASRMPHNANNAPSSPPESESNMLSVSIC
jgi:hypothetical protein